MRENYLLLYIVTFVGVWAVVSGLLLVDFGWNASLLQAAGAVILGYAAASLVVTLLFALLAAGSRPPAGHHHRRRQAAR